MPALEITTRIGCKNVCRYCPQSVIEKAYKEISPIDQMTLDTFKTCLLTVPSRVDIHFSGMSEPWLNQACTEMVLYARETGHRITVFTTLVGMSLSDIDLLKKVDFKTFWVHLPSAEGLEKIVIDEHYLSVLEKVSRALSHVKYRFHGMGINPAVKELLGGSALFVESSTRAGVLTSGGTAVPQRKRERIACSRELKQSVLLPNGDVLLCCMDYGLKHVLGNLLSSDYESLFRGDAFQEVLAGLRNDALDILCRHCDMFAYSVFSLERARSKVINLLK